MAWKWNELYLIHDASINSLVNKTFIQCRFITTWRDPEAHITLHTFHYKWWTKLQKHHLLWIENQTRQYILEPIPSCPRSIPSPYSSHCFLCDTAYESTNYTCFNATIFKMWYQTLLHLQSQSSLLSPHFQPWLTPTHMSFNHSVHSQLILMPSAKFWNIISHWQTPHALCDIVLL